jgi:hypothetical protein
MNYPNPKTKPKIKRCLTKLITLFLAVTMSISVLFIPAYATADSPAPASDTTAPVLSAGVVERYSDKVIIYFTASEGGNFYCQIKNSGDPAPGNDIEGSDWQFYMYGSSGGKRSIQLNLTAGATKDIYFVVAGDSGNVSDPLKISVEAYKETYITSIAGVAIGDETYQDAGTYDIFLASISVPYSVSSISASDIIVSAGTFTIQDADGKAISLTAGTPTTIVIYTQNGQSKKYYYITVTRESEGDTTPTPTPEPTPAPTPEPTPAPTPEPTPAPTPEPTPAPTPEPTPAPTPEPTPATTPEPTPAPALLPEENPYVTPSMETRQTESGTEYTTPSGVTSTVTQTEDEGVKVEAGINESGSVNSQATAAAVSEAAAIAQANGETAVKIELPESTKGISASTVKKLVEAAGDTEVVVNIPTVVNGETVGSVSVPLSGKSGQILTGMAFNTSRTESAENYITKKWDTVVLGSFETAQKGGWGETATLTVSSEILDFEADDGDKLYALIYDTKTKKWYQVSATVEDGNVIIKTKRTGIVTIVTEPIIK